MLFLYILGCSAGSVVQDLWSPPGPDEKNAIICCSLVENDSDLVHGLLQIQGDLGVRIKEDCSQFDNDRVTLLLRPEPRSPVDMLQNAYRSIREKTIFYGDYKGQHQAWESWQFDGEIFRPVEIKEILLDNVGFSPIIWRPWVFLFDWVEDPNEIGFPYWFGVFGDLEEAELLDQEASEDEEDPTLPESFEQADEDEENEERDRNEKEPEYANPEYDENALPENDDEGGKLTENDDEENEYEELPKCEEDYFDAENDEKEPEYVENEYEENDDAENDDEENDDEEDDDEVVLSGAELRAFSTEGGVFRETRFVWDPGDPFCLVFKKPRFITRVVDQELCAEENVYEDENENRDENEEAIRLLGRETIDLLDSEGIGLLGLDKKPKKYKDKDIRITRFYLKFLKKNKKKQLVEFLLHHQKWARTNRFLSYGSFRSKTLLESYEYLSNQFLSNGTVVDQMAKTLLRKRWLFPDEMKDEMRIGFM